MYIFAYICPSVFVCLAISLSLSLTPLPPCTKQALSGLFSATFPLTFAYISDCVGKKERAPAYGLALATFGLSFSLGPLTGSYIARAVDIHAVFGLSLLLMLLNVGYIMMCVSMYLCIYV